MKIFILRLIFFCVMGTALFANSVSQAEIAYQEGRFDLAIKHYTNLLERYPNHSGLLYNIGNSYYKNGQLGNALSAYLSAQRVAPRMPHLRSNIDRIRDQVLVDEEADAFSIERRLIYYVCLFSLNEWLGLWLILSTVLAGLTLGCIFRNQFVRIRHARNVVFFVVIFATLLTSFRFYVEAYYSVGVVVQTKAEVRSGPSDTLPVLFFLHDGTEFKLRKTLNQWVEISLSNGLSGWIEARDIARL